MDKIILKILLRFVKIFNTKNIDFDKLQVIAETKILMDRRRSPVNFKRKQQKEMLNPLWGTLFVYFILGTAIGLLIFSLQSLLVAMIVIHAYLLFMMAMTLITDFSSVLLDTTDNQIILPRPVNSHTLFLARIVHILVYLLQFTIALTIAPIAFTFIQYGLLTGVCMIVTMLLMVAFAVFVTYLLYGLMLRFANEQKIKDIVGYFQIFMTTFFVIGFQVVPRLINVNDNKLSLALHGYSYLLPPVWMAMALEAVQQFNFNSIHIAMIACTVLIPPFTVWIMIRYLAPSFAKKLGALSNTSRSTTEIAIANKGKTALSQKISKLICSSKTETAGFETTWKITGRDKTFKIQFYPSLAYIAVYLFIFVFKSGKDITHIWQGLHTTKMFLFFIYVPIFSVLASLPITSFYDNFAAAWVYQSTPLAKPGELISGSIKLLLVKFFIPIYLFFFAVAFFIWGLPILDDFVFGFFNNLLIFFAVANLSDHYLPFSRQQNIKGQTGKFVRSILQMIIIGLLVGAHYLALQISWLPAALIPVSVTGCYFLLKKIQHLSWSKISF